MGRDAPAHAAGCYRGLEALFQTPDDAGFVQIIRGHLHFDAVTNSEADPALAHLAGDDGEDEVFVVQFDAEHGSGQHGVNDAFNFDGRFFHGRVQERLVPTFAGTSQTSR
jgi:hypothetical protein